MNYAEVSPEVCKHGHLSLMAPYKHEDKTSRRTTNNNSSAQFKKHPDESSAICHKAKRVPDKTAHECFSYGGKGSYQLQRYLKEPTGCGATLFIEGAPTPRRMDLLDSSKANGKKERKKRTATMGKKIRDLERKIGGF
ncbi:uncharacterized protein PAC_20159 [Phialocephala subalpina]|uniref:Uncharacterized protein n=1 Tax=Phialocephala subalpina TaxID=576137 RepID=A0A1L7XZ05_9HELO|nr:uncharacterized protein PAC_20159 [Phialocephala subalpina]